MHFIDPRTPNEWLNVAKSRGNDAKILVSQDKYTQSIAPFYMSGYAVECSLKAYLTMQEITWPKGKDGHNLINLMELTRIPYAALQIQRGVKSYFLNIWTVDLRYQADGTFLEHSPQDLVQAAEKIRVFLEKKINRSRGRKRRKGW